MIPFVFLLLVLLLEAVEAAVTFVIEPSLPWYWSLAKPPLVPAPLVFRAAWTAVYLCLGASFVLVWKRRTVRGSSAAMAWFSLQIVLNALWLWVFTRMRSIAGGMAVLAALIIVAAITAEKSCRVRKEAGFLLFPYLAWLVFLMYLHVSLHLLNRR